MDSIFLIIYFFKIFLYLIIFLTNQINIWHIQTIELYKAFTWLTNTYHLIYHSLSYPICPTMTFLYHLSDHNYIIPLIKSRFSYSDYDWSISLVPKWFNYPTCPFTIYLSPFVSIIFSPFLFFFYLITPFLIFSIFSPFFPHIRS